MDPASPLRIAFLSDEPEQASYLASVLRLELPGLLPLDRDAAVWGEADLVLVGGSAPPTVPRQANGAPVIVVARGPVALADLERLVEDGADDVLDLAQLTARGLAAAVLKALRRKSRLMASSGIRGNAPAWF